MRLLILLAAACVGAAGAPQAMAHPATTAKNVHLRAGPARDYPVVAILPQGTALDVQGCLPDYRWCDVIGLGHRGSVYAANIDSLYEGVAVPLADHGAALGLAVFGFVLGEYWAHHYRDRSWYRQRDAWMHQRHPPGPPMPPPPGPPESRPPPHRPGPPESRPQPHPPGPPVRPAPPRRLPPPPATRPAQPLPPPPPGQPAGPPRPPSSQ